MTSVCFVKRNVRALFLLTFVWVTACQLLVGPRGNPPASFSPTPAEVATADAFDRIPFSSDRVSIDQPANDQPLVVSAARSFSPTRVMSMLQAQVPITPEW